MWRDKEPTFQERVIELAHAVFPIGLEDTLPERMERLLKTKDYEPFKDRTWIFDPGGLEIEVKFEWDQGVSNYSMNAYLKVIDKGSVLPSSCIFGSGNEIDITKGYRSSKCLRGVLHEELTTKVEACREAIATQYAALVEPEELKVVGNIYPHASKFEAVVQIEEPGWIRRRMVFVCNDERSISKKIDPHHESSDISSSICRQCASRENAESWIAKVTRALEKRNEEMCPKEE